MTKRWQPTPEDCDLAEKGAANGLSLAQIAASLGTTPATLGRAMKRDSRLADAIARGRGSEEQALVGSLFKKAMEGNVVAAIFLLKSRHGYRDVPQQKPEKSRVRVELTLPASLTPEQYQQVLDVVPKRKLIEERTIRNRT